MSDQTKASDPQIRVRIAHTKVKEGWRLSETTVEWVGSEPINWLAIHDAMRVSYQNGDMEAMERNTCEASRPS